MGVVHAPSNQDPLVILELLELRDLASLVFHNESDVRIDAQCGHVFRACILKVTVQYLSKTALFCVRVGMSLVRLQHDYSHFR